MRIAPPGAASIEADVPIHRTRRSGSVQQPQTTSREAATTMSRSTRTAVSSGASGSRTVTLLLLALGQGLERVEPVVPERIEPRPNREEARLAGSIPSARAV